MEQYFDKIIALTEDESYHPMAPEEMSKALGFEGKPADFSSIIKNMENGAFIIISKKGKIMSPISAGFIAGVYSSSERGFGFVIPDRPTPFGDLFIPARFGIGAMHGDRVFARITARSDGQRKAEGELIKIIKRNTNIITGTFDKSKNNGYVVPDNKKFYDDIFVRGVDSMKAKDGDKVVVEIERYGDGRRNHEGKVIRLLGDAKSRGANYMSILYDHNIETVFPPDVIAQAKAIPQQVSPADTAGRLDLRNEIIYTIDGADAKDFDDAISIKKLDNGNYYLGVHIADVSHYVTAGSPLDKEAFKRGTSVYFVDQVVPMLPVELSNGICSLNPKVDRLAFSAFMEIDKDGSTVKHEIKKTVIKSCERLVYTDVTKVLEGSDPALLKRYDYLIGHFKLMDELSNILFEKRKRRGAINFDFPEPKIIVDEKGEPIEILRRDRGVSDRIIEEFMLAANETVAEHVNLLNKPFVYRIHESPNTEKTDNFLSTARLLGYNISTDGGKLTPMTLQKMLEQISGKPEEKMLSTMMLRSLMKATYSPSNLGHFGLAAKYYCHFTSPIRRYPDLAIHRILSDLISIGIEGSLQKRYESFAFDAAKQSSETEVNAAEAERDIDNLYIAIYMSKRIGEEFEGTISSVAGFGMFVELDNTVEGLIRINSLDDDFYIFDESSLSLRGERTGNKFRIGDKIRVKVAGADIISRQIDFVLAGQ